MIHGDHSTVFMGKKHARNITCSVINSFQNVFVSASAVQKKHFSAVRFQNIAVSVITSCVYYSHEHFSSPRFQSSSTYRAVINSDECIYCVKSVFSVFISNLCKISAFSINFCVNQFFVIVSYRSAILAFHTSSSSGN